MTKLCQLLSEVGIGGAVSTIVCDNHSQCNCLYTPLQLTSLLSIFKQTVDFNLILIKIWVQILISSNELLTHC